MHHPSSPDSVLAQQELEHKPPTPRAANGVELNLKAVWQATTLGTSKQVIKYLKKKYLKNKLRHVGMDVSV